MIPSHPKMKSKSDLLELLNGFRVYFHDEDDEITKQITELEGDISRVSPMAGCILRSRLRDLEVSWTPQFTLTFEVTGVGGKYEIKWQPGVTLAEFFKTLTGCELEPSSVTELINNGIDELASEIEIRLI